MDCEFSKICGGCSYRDLSTAEYRKLKSENFAKILKPLGDGYVLNPPIFINDGTRRRLSMAFSYSKGKLVMGFNQKSSKEVVDIAKCCSLRKEINAILPFVRQLITDICLEPYQLKKGKKIINEYIRKGDVFICSADNGIDIVLDCDAPLELNHRQIIFEKAHQNDAVIRISHRRASDSYAETIVEKSRPEVKIGEYFVSIPSGTFLQPSKEGEEALCGLVKKYLHGVKGTIADLFCGVGTFSYILCSDLDVNIIASDSSQALLEGFQKSLNANQIKNIKILNRNLFKYPFKDNELKGVNAVVFDPPRAGASAQCQALADSEFKPAIIVAISCNPATFVNDAQKLISGGYELKEVTMVDQFVYSNHSELVAFFTKANM